MAPRLTGVNSGQRLAATPRLPFDDAGIGVVSFGIKDLEWLKGYVQNQKEHHVRGTVFDRQEPVEPEEAQGPAEEAPGVGRATHPFVSCSADVGPESAGVGEPGSLTRSSSSSQTLVPARSLAESWDPSDS